MTPEQQQQLQTLNTDVNAIPYDSILGTHEPPDWWTDTPVSGNSFVCRDYVLEKAEKLREAGWPVTDLSVILTWTEVVIPPAPENDNTGREYHAVLGVKVDSELWILDSRFDPIYLPANCPADYKWQRQQDTNDNLFHDISQTGPT